MLALRIMRYNLAGEGGILGHDEGSSCGAWRQAGIAGTVIHTARYSTPRQARGKAQQQTYAKHFH